MSEKKSDTLSKIKQFFSKKKLDNKFKHAGEGHRLDDSSRLPIINSKPEYIVTPRQELSESAQKAAEAALIREYDKKSVKPKMKIDTSSQRTEMELDRNELQKAYELRDRAMGKTVELDKSKHLNELKFCCPVLFEYDIIGPYHEIKEKIFSYLDSEVDGNPLEASCLIIFSKCVNQENLKSCLNILETLLNNLIKSPNEGKFRKIRLSNDKIRKNIVEIEGAIGFLKAIGFHSEEQPKSDNSEETESFLVMSDEACIPEQLAVYLEKLQQAEPIKPVLYRDTVVYHKSNLVNISENDLPEGFFRLSLDEIKKYNALRKQQMEESGMLLTKQMRENLKVRDRRNYRYVLIRVLFPNNWILQGTFEACNKVSAIKDWLTDCLKVNEPFFMAVPPITKRIDDLDQTIVDANLAPCSILRLIFENYSLNQCNDKDNNAYLKDALLT